MDVTVRIMIDSEFYSRQNKLRISWNQQLKNLLTA